MSKKRIDIDAYREQLKNNLLRIFPSVNQNQLTELCEQFEFHEFDKRDVILNAGEFSNTVYFVCKGLVRIYYTKEEKEITNWFIKENMMFAATYSILTGQNNYSNYEALEDTHVLQLDYNILEKYYTKYHSLEHLGRRIIELYYGSFMKKTYDVLFLSAEERYTLFLRDHEDLLNRVPLRYIASYLGITQETLSRLRSKSIK